MKLPDSMEYWQKFVIVKRIEMMPVFCAFIWLLIIADFFISLKTSLGSLKIFDDRMMKFIIDTDGICIRFRRNRRFKWLSKNAYFNYETQRAGWRKLCFPVSQSLPRSQSAYTHSTKCQSENGIPWCSLTRQYCSARQLARPTDMQSVCFSSQPVS